MSNKPVFIPKNERIKKTQSTNISTPKVAHLISTSTVSSNNPITNKSQPRSATIPIHERKKEKKLRFEWDRTDDTSSLEPSILDDPSILPVSTKKSDVLDQKENIREQSRHWTLLPLCEMQPRDWRIFREEFDISVKGSGNIEPPIRYWKEFEHLEDEMINLILNKASYNTPTPIQKQAIPVILQGRDLIGIAETGSGKTAAFVIPLIQTISKLPPITSETIGDGPYAVVLAPTRELAQQIEREMNLFGKRFSIRSLSIIGGHSISEQSFDMREGVELIVGTPGRLRDLLEQHLLAFNRIKYLIMDEADKMVDLGFSEDIDMIMQEILNSSRERAQVTMFSATMPIVVERLAQRFLKNPVTITVGSPGYAAVDRIVQAVEMIGFSHSSDKNKKLLEILGKDRYELPIIVFCNTKKTVDTVFKVLESQGWRVSTLHGGLSQVSRESSLSQLKSGHCDILVATDVAGRGIDVANVGLVVNYDMPTSIEAYLHRIGRTGRAGKSGNSITFLTSEDSSMFWELKRVMERSSRSIMPSEFLKHPSTLARPGVEAVKRRHEQIVYTT